MPVVDSPVEGNGHYNELSGTGGGTLSYAESAAVC